MLSDLLYHNAGLKGVSGISDDMRELLHSKTEAAIEAIELYCTLAAKQIAGLVPSIGGLDALVFTGGIGVFTWDIVVFTRFRVVFTKFNEGMSVENDWIRHVNDFPICINDPICPVNTVWILENGLICRVNKLIRRVNAPETSLPLGLVLTNII